MQRGPCDCSFRVSPSEQGPWVPSSYHCPHVSPGLQLNLASQVASTALISLRWLDSALWEARAQYWKPETYTLCFRYKRLTSHWVFICCISYWFTRRLGPRLCRPSCRTRGLLNPSQGPGRNRATCSALFPTTTDGRVQEVPSATWSTAANWYHRRLGTPPGQELRLLMWGITGTTSRIL